MKHKKEIETHVAHNSNCKQKGENIMKHFTFKLATMGIVLFSAALISDHVFADVTKAEGSTELVATDPEVTVTKSDDTIWSEVNVNIKTDIPDEVQINQGDTMTFNVPNELSFETNYNFPVYNSTGESEVGNAEVKATENTVTTTFNNYFAEHPLDKSISLNLNTRINREVVQPDTKHEISFNGTVVELNAGSKGVEPTDEALYKYGWQDKDDPSVVNWTARINYKKSYMENVNISDTWSDDQEYVENSLKFYYVKSVDPFVYDAPATDALANAKLRTNGFDTNLAKIDKQTLYVEYKTKLKQMEHNPTNKINVSWDGGGTGFDAETKLVGGNGRADGKTRPTFEIPKESPKVEIPEFQGGIPGIPEEREKLPEWTGGVVPNEAPQVDKPEFQGGIPGIPEERVKPEFEGGIPGIPEVREKPELDINDIPKDPETPKPQDPKPVDPKTPKPQEPKAPKVKKVVEKEPVKNDITPTTPASEPAPAKATPVFTQKTLPVTGSVASTLITIVGVIAGSLALGLVTYSNYDMRKKGRK